MVDQEMINKLRPGMDKKQVKHIMGTPLIIDPFHNDRWDYLYSFEPGKGEREQRRITLYFNGDHLARIDGDVMITEAPVSPDETHQDRTVAVPLEEDKPGFFKRMFSKNKPPETEVSGGSPTDTEATAAKDEAAVPTDTEATAVIEETSAPMGTEPAAAEVQPLEDTAQQPDSTTDTQAPASTADTTAEQSTAGNTQEKNLLRRFWDRMTKSDVETDMEEETEQDIRDAEVLKDAGGEL